MSVFITIFAGFTVFVLGQIFLKWFIEPVQEFRKLQGEILFIFANDHAAIHNARAIDEKEAIKVMDKLYKLGAKLHSCIHLIPIYNKTRHLFSLPEEEKVIFAAKIIHSMANIMFGSSADIHYKLDLDRIQVCEALGIKDPIQGSMTKDELLVSIDKNNKRNNA